VKRARWLPPCLQVVRGGSRSGKSMLVAAMFTLFRDSTLAIVEVSMGVGRPALQHFAFSVPRS
jgi:predicted AAA+ superfamily ATPase